MTLLSVVGVTKNFEGVTALRAVSFKVPQRCVMGIIGPNGAGKTTLLNTINGIYRPDSGKAYFKEIDLNQLSPFQIAWLGISRTFQVAKVFRRISVRENLLTASLRLKASAAEVEDKIDELLNLVGLLDKGYHYAYELSGGQQKLLEFARALMADPLLVLMDEPFAGVHPEVKSRLLECIKKANSKDGTTFLIVSHDVQLLSDLCQRIMVLNFGEKLIEGPTANVLADQLVVDAYLGG